MKLSTKSQYGLTAIVNLANKNGRVLLKDIAREEHISEKYLEAIFSLLKKGGIVHGTRGARGGYRLAQKPENITLYELLNVLEGSLCPVDSSDIDNVSIRNFWQGLCLEIKEHLKKKRLSDFIKRRENTYYI